VSVLVVVLDDARGSRSRMPMSILGVFWSGFVVEELLGEDAVIGCDRS
jgi:hypothetical protein